MNGIYKPLARLTNNNRGKTHIINIRNERKDLNIDPTDTKRIIRDTISNFNHINSTTYIKCSNSLKATNYQNLPRNKLEKLHL